MKRSSGLSIWVPLLTSLAWISSTRMTAQDTSPSPGSRTWTAADGRTIEARLVNDLGWRVILERNGVKMTVPLGSLSDADREWLDARWKADKSRKIGADPQSSTAASGDTKEAVRLAEQIRDMGFEHPAWRTLAADEGSTGGGAPPALRLQIRKARFLSIDPPKGFPGTPPRNGAVYYVLLNSRQAGGTIAYTEVVWDEDKDLFASTPSLAQILSEKIESEKYTALALAGEYDALKHHAARILDSAETTASMQEQRACLLALGDGRCVDTVELARICAKKLTVPELCLEAARALGLSRGVKPEPVLAQLEALREHLKEGGFHAKCVRAREADPRHWDRLGLQKSVELSQVVDFAVIRLKPDETLKRLNGMIERFDDKIDYDEFLEFFAILRPCLIDEIRRAGLGSKKAENWMNYLIRQADPEALRLVLDSLTTCKDDKEFWRLLKYVKEFKSSAEHWHDGITRIRGCDASPFLRSWARNDFPSDGRFLDRGEHPEKLIPLPLHERAVELLVNSLSVRHGALDILKSLKETALPALPGLSLYLQKLPSQNKKDLTYFQKVIFETIEAIATAARSKAMDLPPLSGLAEAVAEDLNRDSPLLKDACAVLKPLGKQASAVVPQLQALTLTIAGQKIAPQLKDTIASIQADAAAPAAAN